DQELLRHAAAQHAGAADAHRFHDRDLGAVARRAPRRRDAAGAGADHQVVEVETAHRLSPAPTCRRFTRPWPPRYWTETRAATRPRQPTKSRSRTAPDQRTKVGRRGR